MIRGRNLIGQKKIIYFTTASQHVRSMQLHLGSRRPLRRRLTVGSAK